jgi:hypothetical protein
VPTREIETLLADAGVAHPPLAARLARIAGGRPGIAMAWAQAPEAVLAREQLARTLLDLTSQRPAERLAAMRAAMPLAVAVAAVEDERIEVPGPADGARPTVASKAGGRRRAAPAVAAADAGDDDADGEAVAPARASAAERRRAIEAIVAVWTDLARDLAVFARGQPDAVHDIALLDEARAAAAGQDASELLAFLERLGRATTVLAGNVSPELILDDLILAWPASRR